MAHMGKALQQVISRTPYSVEDVANAVSVTRRTMYLWFEKEELSGDKVDRVSSVIGVDIRATMPGVFPPGKSIITRAEKKKQDTSGNMIEYWKDRFTEVSDELTAVKARLARYEKV